MPNRATTPVVLLSLTFFLSSRGAEDAAAQGHPEDARIDPVRIEPGSGSFTVAGGQPYPGKMIRVFYHRPESLHAGSPVVLVIPGAGRNGDDYRDAWVRASEEYGVLVLSPSYPETFYPEFWSYNLAGMTREVTLDLSFVIETNPEAWTLDDVQEELDSRIGMQDLVGDGAGNELLHQLVLLARAGMLTEVNVGGTSSVASVDPEQWIFDDFDRIFDVAREALELETETYDLFGHSAGGQILHRLALFRPDTAADRILAANSGWYTVPSFQQEFPYGLKDSGMAVDQLDAAFASRLVVFLGEEDDADETRGSLTHHPEVDRQGLHRLERGQHFFERAREAAEARGADFEWRLEIIPGIGHDYERMSEAAARYLYGG